MDLSADEQLRKLLSQHPIDDLVSIILERSWSKYQRYIGTRTEMTDNIVTNMLVPLQFMKQLRHFWIGSWVNYSWNDDLAKGRIVGYDFERLRIKVFGENMKNPVSLHPDVLFLR